MKTIKMLCLAMAVALAAISAEYKSGTTSILYKIDEASKTLTVMGQTAYDPKTDEGTSIYKIKWNDTTVFTNKKANVPADQIKPGSTAVVTLNAKNVPLLLKGEAFAATVNIYDDEKKYDWNEKKRILTTKIWPADKNAFEVEFEGKRVKGNGTITQYSKGTLKDLVLRQSELLIAGKKQGDDFLAQKVVNTVKDDPRKDDDPKLPTALVVGDSISMNYHNDAKKALAGKFNYHRIPANSGDTNRGVATLAMWVGDYSDPKYAWQVIVLNHGLHDLLQHTNMETKEILEQHKVEVDLYKKNLEKEIRFLLKTGAKIVWCMTTPVPGSSYSWGPYSRRKDEDLVYNAAAAEVLKKYPQVQICDLNAVVRNSSIFDKWRTGTNVHFKPGVEQATLGKAVADAILKAYNTK